MQDTDMKTGVRAMLAREDKTIGSKIILIVFDKVVLGLLALAVGAYAQYQISKSSFQSELREKLYETQVQSTLEGRKEVVAKVGKFLETAAEATYGSSAPNLPATLQQEIVDVSNSVLALSAYYSGADFTPEGDILTKRMSEFVSAIAMPLAGGDRMTRLKSASAAVAAAARSLYASIDNATLIESAKDTSAFLRQLSSQDEAQSSTVQN